MKGLLPSTYWIRVKYEIASVKGAPKLMIQAIDIPSIEDEPKLKLRGNNNTWCFLDAHLPGMADRHTKLSFKLSAYPLLYNVTGAAKLNVSSS